ncbi:MAG: DegV family protein [Halanaerobiaceae bacterium]
MKIGLLTDSTCDLNPELLNKHDIEFVPLSIYFSEEISYKDIVDIQYEAFFRKLAEAENIPTTTQPAIGLFVQKYEEMLEKYDAIISIHLSEKLSGTCQTARMAANQVSGDIHVIDSKSATLGLGFQVIKIKKMINKGKKPDEIVDYIKELRQSIDIYFTINELTYLQKGGRIGKAQAFLGSILNFYPILLLSGKSGEITPYEKVRGKKKIVSKLINIVETETEGVDEASLGFVHAIEMKHYENFKEKLVKQLEDKDLKYIKNESWVSSVLGSHVGPSVYGVVIAKGETLEI